MLLRKPSRTRCAVVIHAALAAGMMTGCAGPDDVEVVAASYLQQAAVTASGPAASALRTCEREGPIRHERALASHRVLTSLIDGDTAMVLAEVITVARVHRAPDDTLEVTRETRVDTLSWVLIRPAADSSWGICGLSFEGVAFVRMDTIGNGVRWVGGTSLAAILAAADSVARDTIP